MAVKKLQAIYEPKGPAREYAALALNPYKGCTHGCTYCYNARRFGADGKFFADAAPRLDIIDKVEHDCKVLQAAYGDNCPEIHLTFLGDCYQPAELEYMLTRQVIITLIQYDLPFTILTKSQYILRDVDLLAPYKRCRIGFSFTTVDPEEAAIWEPNISPIKNRISTLRQFAEFGKVIWISLEPVMRIESTIEVIEHFKALPDFYWIGALNHFAPPQPIDLIEARIRIGAVLDKHHCIYKFKSSVNSNLG